jgi:hypothetical protein
MLWEKNTAHFVKDGLQYAQAYPVIAKPAGKYISSSREA